MNPAIHLCRVDIDLVGHVIQLLDDADIAARTGPPDESGRVAVLVPGEDAERARAVVELVLPHLVEGTGHPGQLSRRLVRSEDSTSDRDTADSTYASSDSAATDDFVPQPPPPLPRPRDAVSRAAWLGVIAGPILLLLVVLLHLPGVLTAAGLVAFIAGFATLIARMPDRARQDDGWDDGAVL